MLFRSAEMSDDFLHRIDRYHETRDYPAVKGPSYLSAHLRFGTISIRRAAREAYQRMVGEHQGLQTAMDMIDSMLEEEKNRD